MSTPPDTQRAHGPQGAKVDGDARRRVYFVSLGCSKNQVDTEVMLGVVRDEGGEIVDDPALADTLVVNTCGFIEPAKIESIDTILDLARYKAQRPRTLVVAGCLSQRHPEELAAELPEVDHFLGSADMLGLRNVLRGTSPRMAVSPLSRRAYLYDHTAPRQTIGPRHTSVVKIAEGCDRPCAFCIIPQLRGPQRSRAVPDIVEEVVGLVQQGTREIRLVAQDLTKYGDDFADRGLVPANLEHLLDALVRIDGLHWIRLHYAYPTATTDGILDRIVGHAKIANYLDVPFQHVDSDVLKKMRRGYGEKQIRDLVERVHARSTSDRRIWLRTTLLVGHPGETEDAFSRLLDFIEEGHVDHLGVFPWSKEDGTASALLPLRVGEDVGRRRAEEAMAVQAELRREANLDMRGEVLEVLVDGPSSESEFLYDARHEGQAPEVDGRVIVCDAVAKPGDLLRVKIIDAEAHDLVGSVDLDREVEFRDDDV